MRYKKSVIEVKIRIDPVEGWGHNPSDHVEMLQEMLNSAVHHYKPEVRLLRVVWEGRTLNSDSTAQQGELV